MCRWCRRDLESVDCNAAKWIRLRFGDVAISSGIGDSPPFYTATFARHLHYRTTAKLILVGIMVKLRQIEYRSTTGVDAPSINPNQKQPYEKTNHTQSRHRRNRHDGFAVGLGASDRSGNFHIFSKSTTLLRWQPPTDDPALTQSCMRFVQGHPRFASEVCFARFLNFNGIAVNSTPGVRGFLRSDRLHA